VKTVFVAGVFDELQAAEMRFFEEAASYGSLHVLLLDVPQAKFPIAERRYLLEAIRYVSQVRLLASLADIPAWAAMAGSALWVIPAAEDTPERRAMCVQHALDLAVIAPARLHDFPESPPALPGKARKAIVTGCFDYLHSGHVRFFEEAAQWGALYAVVGNDANVRLLKGEGHPLYPQEQRRYLVSAIRHVRAALVSTGSGWMDAEPEIAWLKPDVYVVNEDGDKPEKREFCAAHGMDYVVLQRQPAPGLPRRSSTDLRGF